MKMDKSKQILTELIIISWVKNKSRIKVLGSTDVKVRKGRLEFRCLKVFVSVLPVISRIVAERLEIGCVT